MAGKREDSEARRRCSDRECARQSRNARTVKRAEKMYMLPPIIRHERSGDEVPCRRAPWSDG